MKFQKSELLSVIWSVHVIASSGVEHANLHSLGETPRFSFGPKWEKTCLPLPATPRKCFLALLVSYLELKDDSEAEFLGLACPWQARSNEYTFDAYLEHFLFLSTFGVTVIFQKKKSRNNRLHVIWVMVQVSSSELKWFVRYYVSKKSGSPLENLVLLWLKLVLLCICTIVVPLA